MFSDEFPNAKVNKLPGIICIKSIFDGSENMFECRNEGEHILIGTIFDNQGGGRQNRYIYLEDDGDPSSWVDVPEEVMKKYFKEVK